MSKQFTRIILGFTIVAIVAGMVAFFFAIKSSISMPKSDSTGINLPSVEIAKKQSQPKFNIYLKDGKSLVVEWRDLPFDTVRISLYRSKDQKNWELWKEIPASSFAMNGSFEIKGIADAGQYYYRAEAMSGVGDVVWQSGTTPISNAPLPTSTSETATSSPTGPAQGGQDTGTTGQTGNTGGSPAPTSTPPANRGSETGSDNPITRLIKWIFYYNPQGQLIGTSSLQSEPFWVSYADQTSIEIGWQDLPAGTDALRVFRSETQSGPWLQLLYQQGVDASTANSIKVVDHSTAKDQYYKMEALGGSQVLQGYGPVLLPAYKN